MIFQHVRFCRFSTEFPRFSISFNSRVTDFNAVHSTSKTQHIICIYIIYFSKIDLAFRLSSMVSNCRQRVYLLHKLIMSVTVETLTQENVSCLNTSLVFLMFALDKGFLPVYLKAFRSEAFILDNLRYLLLK